MRNLVLISYFFPPHQGVGGLRAAGFGRYLPEYGWNVKVVTASGSEDRFHTNSTEYVPAKGVSFLTRALPVQDPGIKWCRPLKRWLNNSRAAREADAIMITGGPFLHMELAPWVKTRVDPPLITLDFRDPFANNPAFSDRWIRDLVARALERRWLNAADLVTVASEPMVDLLADSSGNVQLVRNGYDDEVVRSVVRDGGGTDYDSIDFLEIVYAGSFSTLRDPRPLLEALTRLRGRGRGVILNHVGTQATEFEEELREYQRRGVYRPLGYRPYRETLKVVSQSHIGLVVGSGKRFEATTKIFDYIGLGKPILILNAPWDGAIIDIAEAYGRFRRVDNDARAIEEQVPVFARETLRQQDDRLDEREEFGRSYQVRRLAHYLDQTVEERRVATNKRGPVSSSSRSSEGSS